MELIPRLNRLYHYLDLDYPIDKEHYESQTNQKINEIANEFIGKYRKDLRKKVFILEYQDDLYSLVAYSILKNIQGIYPFNFRIFNMTDKRVFLKTRKQFYKKDKISLRQLKKLDSEKIVWISCFNPLYKVGNRDNIFRKMRSQDFSIIRDFTPEQFQIMKKFYGIDDSSFVDSAAELKNYSMFCNGEKINEEIFTDEWFYSLDNWTGREQVNLVKIEGNEADFKVFDEIKDSKLINLYFVDNSNENCYNNLNQLRPYVKRHNSSKSCNTYSYKDFDLRKFLMDNFELDRMEKVKFVGNWTEKEIRDLMEVK